MIPLANYTATLWRVGRNERIYFFRRGLIRTIAITAYRSDEEEGEDILFHSDPVRLRYDDIEAFFENFRRHFQAILSKP